jgi:intracellular multiplication protein IcmO
MANNQNPIYGVRPEDEIDIPIYRPTLASSFTRFMRSVRNKDLACLVLVMMALVAMMFPLCAPFLPFAGGFFVWYVMTKKTVPIMRVPIQENRRKDLKQPKQLGNPKSGFESPTGIFFVGWDIGSGQELWMSNEDAREHFWIIGTTGSGKTELLMAFVVNALSWGSGAYVVDGKGDVRTARKLYQLCRALGRDDDFLCINFMVPGRNSGFAGMLTNTTNPMSTYGQDEIIQMLLSMLPPTSGDSGSWQERAISMISALVPVLVWLRDNLGVPLSINDLRAAMIIHSLIKMAGRHDPMYADVPEELIGSVKSYLLELAVPEDVIDQGGQPSPESQTQHGYRMQFFSRPLSSLGDSYRHIFGRSASDVDVFDCVLNRRVVISILPALGKSMAEMENLGRILIANMKVMLGDALGSQIEGTWNKAVEQRQTASLSPYCVIFDEVSFYLSDGMSMLPAQGRSLGFSFIFALQSLQGAINRNQKEATEAFGTVNTKIYMKIEDSMASTEQAEKSAGKAVVSKATGYERQTGEFGSHHQLNASVQLDTVSRTDVRDLRKQWRGEMTMQNGDTLVRAKCFYVDDTHIFDNKEKVVMRLNHFIGLDEIKPEDEAETKAADSIFEIISKLSLTQLPGFDTMIQAGEVETVSDAITLLVEANPDMTLSTASGVGMAYLFRQLNSMDSRMMGGGAGAGSNFSPRRRPPIDDDIQDPPMMPRKPPLQTSVRRRGGGIDSIENDTIIRSVTALDQPPEATAADVSKAFDKAIVRSQSPTYTPEATPEPTPELTPGAKSTPSAPVDADLEAGSNDEDVMNMFRDLFEVGGGARLVDEGDDEK